MFVVAPDITRNDGIFSQYVLSVTSVGYYSSICHLKNSSGSTLRIWPGSSFHVSLPGDPFEDVIPPSRITNLQISVTPPYSFTSQSAILNFTWTAPGGDLNQGRARLYKFYCGYSRDSLSYDDCNSIPETVMIPHDAGTQEINPQPFEDFDKEVFFAVETKDSLGNVAEKSNIASVYISSITTTTSSPSKLI